MSVKWAVAEQSQSVTQIRVKDNNKSSLDETIVSYGGGAGQRL